MRAIGLWLILAGLIVGSVGRAETQQAIPDRTVVLTFDDAVKSHRTFVAPLLQELGFGASFYITACWMDDAEHFLSWEDVAEIHAMGFEIGNHTWTHAGFSSPESAEKLADELERVDKALEAVGVPKPTTFAWPGNGFGPESLAVLREKGYLFARRGMQPEQPYGQIKIGPLYDPAKHDPLLIPTTGDAYPSWTLEHFKQVVNQVEPGRPVILQFHGVPDVAHPWVHTSQEQFREYMGYLKEGDFRVIALRDLAEHIEVKPIPEDPMTRDRHPKKKG